MHLSTAPLRLSARRRIHHYGSNVYLQLNIICCMCSEIECCSLLYILLWLLPQQSQGLDAGGGGRIRAESSIWGCPVCCLWCCTVCTWNVEMDTNNCHLWKCRLSQVSLIKCLWSNACHLGKYRVKNYINSLSSVILLPGDIATFCSLRFDVSSPYSAILSSMSRAAS
jgi:hypothetical protein